MKHRMFSLFALVTVASIALMTACKTDNAPTTPPAPADTPTNTPTSTLSPTVTFTRTITFTRTNTNTPTSTGTPTNTLSPTITMTPTVTNTPCGASPVTFETFESAPPWDSLPNFMVGSEAGYQGTTSGWTWDTNNHSGGHSLESTINYSGNYGYGFVIFKTAFGQGGSGGPLDVTLCGSAPASISLWLYSSETTTFFFGLKDSVPVSTYDLHFNPPTPFLPANTWTNVVLPLTVSEWDANIATIDWTHLVNVLVAPNDIVGAGARTATFWVDDVQFLP